MKKMVVKTIAYMVILFVLVNILLFYAATDNDFIGGIIQKHELLSKASGPRIILIGGSGVGYSVDSEAIIKETGMPVVNMGVFGQFGLRYMLEEVKAEVQSGDILVVIPEYSHFYYMFEGWRGLNELIFVYPKSLFYLSSKAQFKAMAKTFPRFYKKKIEHLGQNLIAKWTRTTPRPISYNQYGDYVAHLDSEEIFPLQKEGLFHDFVKINQLKLNKKVVETLNAFEQEMREKGATMLFSYPTVPDVQFAAFQRFPAEIARQVAENAHFKVLNTPADEVQPLNDFYDTVYHLNREGRTKRTRRLINYLKPFCQDIN